MLEVTVESAQRFFAEAFAPWLHGLNVTIEEIGPERAVLRMAFGEHLCRDGGMICGQALMSLADTAMVFAMIGASGRVRPMTTVGQTTSMMKAIMDADVIAEARVVRLGRTLAFGEIFLRPDGVDEPAVHATSTVALLPEK
ncbi:MAG TPA: PaaI family thioesterase [Alphaproteobacteria bacterium]|nr:PaaI family thioesterase [Alphaproteobacteria bacterium]